MKILLLTDCLEDTTGGAENQIYLLAKNLDKQHYEITIASLDGVGQLSCDMFKKMGCHCETFRVRRIYGLSGLFQGIRFYQYLRKNHIQVVMTYHFSSDLWGTFWAKLAGVPKIISNRRDMGFWRKDIHVMAYKLINRWVTDVVAVTRSVAGVVRDQEGVAQSMIHVIENGVEVAAMSESLPVVDELSKGLVIMHVANLRPVKGHVCLITAFADVVKEIKDVRLILIGEDRLNGEIQRQVAELGISEHVDFLGKRSDVRTLLRRADICVLPSLSEGMSNAILEYMAAGKPVIATKVGGNPELIEDGVHGLLTSKMDVAQLRAAMLTLLKDRQTREEMGRRGRLRVQEEFSIQKMINAYCELFA